MQHTTETVTKLAKAFRTLLERDLDAEALVEMDELNLEEENEGICHSHDFLDANMTMLEAWTSVVGRDPTFLAGGLDADALAADADRHLWNAAWGCMKQEAAR